MKKLVLFFAIVSAVALASCGGKQKAAEQEEAVAPQEEVVGTYEVEEVAAEVTPDSVVVVEEAPVAEGEVVEVAE